VDGDGTILFNGNCLGRSLYFNPVFRQLLVRHWGTAFGRILSFSVFHPYQQLFISSRPTEILGTVRGCIGLVTLAFPTLFSAVILGDATASMPTYVVFATVLALILLVPIFKMELGATDFKAALTAKYQ